MKNNKVIIIILFILLFSISIFLLVVNLSRKKGNNENIYKDNQIIYKEISYEDIAQIYLADYLNLIRADSSEAYKLLDKNYYISYEDFLDKIEYLEENDFELESYNVKEKDDYRLFYIKDNNNNTIIFKEKEIMNYTVYLDENTIEK